MLFGKNDEVIRFSASWRRSEERIRQLAESSMKLISSLKYFFRTIVNFYIYPIVSQGIAFIVVFPPPLSISISTGVFVLNAPQV